MKQNNRKNTWRAVVAVVLVMASLFAVSTAVSAGFVEKVFEEVCELMTTSSSGTSETCDHTPDGGVRTYTWTCPHGGHIYTTETHCTKCGTLLGLGGASVGCPENICQSP